MQPTAVTKVTGEIIVRRRRLSDEVRLALHQWLQGQSAGTRLPAERRLAQLMEVSRPTLRKAFDEMLGSGEIERVGRKTFVGRRLANGGVPADGHPFIHAGMVPPSRPTTFLQMAVFETLPAQKRCWERLRDRFNASNPEVQMLVHDLPVEVQDTAQYADFIQRQKLDLILLQPAMLDPLRDAGVLKPIPESLSAELRSDAYLWRAMRPKTNDAAGATYGAPLHCGFFLLAWNADLTGDRFAAADGVVDARTALRWYREAASIIPDQRWVAANPADLVAVAPYDFDAWSSTDIRTYAAEAVTIGTDLMSMDRRRFLCRESERRAGLQAFADGRAAFAIGPSYLMLELLRTAPFRWRAAVATPPEPYRAPTGATMLGITADVGRAAQAAEVVRFLVSAPAQSIIAEETLNCPLRKDSMAPLARFLDIDPDSFLRAMGRLRLADERRPSVWNWFTHYVIMPCLNEAIGKALPPDRDGMVRDLVNKLEGQFPSMKEKGKEGIG